MFFLLFHISYLFLVLIQQTKGLALLPLSINIRIRVGYIFKESSVLNTFLKLSILLLFFLPDFHLENFEASQICPLSPYHVVRLIVLKHSSANATLPLAQRSIQRLLAAFSCYEYFLIFKFCFSFIFT